MALSSLKYWLLCVFAGWGLVAHTQHTVTKYNANMVVQGKSLSGILIQSSSDTANRFVFVSKLGLKFFDVETKPEQFSYTVRYFSPAFKTEKRVIGIVKELFVLGFNGEVAKKKGASVKLISTKEGFCKRAFGLLGKRVRVCYVNDNITIQCKFYPVSFNLKTIK